MEQDMTRGNPLSVIFMFTLPLAVGNIFQQLYNMADTIIVGRFVGADALAAVGSTGTIMFLLNGFAQGITAGFSVLTAQRFGAGKSADGCTAHVPDFPKIVITASTLDAALLEVKQQIQKALRQYKNPPIPTKQEQIVVPQNSVLVLIKAG